jgi:hypothetical protein
VVWNKYVSKFSPEHLTNALVVLEEVVLKGSAILRREKKATRKRGLMKREKVRKVKTSGLELKKKVVSELMTTESNIGPITC